MIDAEVRHAIELETERQTHNIELIASENYVSRDVLEAVGSILTNKYAEGYPGRRYYGGCVDVDKIENLARERVCELFQAEHANVQPHSGSQANMAGRKKCHYWRRGVNRSICFGFGKQEYHLGNNYGI